MYDDQRPAQHLAWHETLEMHELVAFQSNHLMTFKMQLPKVQDPTLRGLYMECINGLQQNLRELIPYYQKVPTAGTRSREDEPERPHMTSGDLTAYHAGCLLGFAKSAVRNYAVAITETATPSLRETFQKHLLNAIQLHGNVFYFMYQRSYYPAYKLDQLLANDLKMAQTALSM